MSIEINATERVAAFALYHAGYSLSRPSRVVVLSAWDVGW